MSNEFKPSQPGSPELVEESLTGTITSVPCPKCGLAVAATLDSCPVDGTPTREIVIDADALERYKLLSPIGEGGMSVVYKAQHLLMDKFVAVKLLHARTGSGSAAVKRFQQEAKAASLLRHPNITPVHDFGVLPNGTAFLVMEFEPGESLANYIKRHGPLSPSKALPLFIGIAQALAHAHKQGVLHRDLKPGNVMVHIDESGNLEGRLVDFGIAKVVNDGGNDCAKPQLTATGEVFGSPAYMSPEQCQGQAVDQRSDLYSLGCLMYEALSGEVPHTGDTSFDIIYKRLNNDASPLPVRSVGSAPEKGLRAIIDKCLQRAPEKRYASAGEMLNDLRALVDGRVLSARLTARKRPTISRIFIAAGPLVVVAIAIASFLMHGANRNAQNSTSSPSAPAPLSAQQGEPAATSEALTPAEGIFFPANRAKSAPKGWNDVRTEALFKNSTDYGSINFSDSPVTDRSMQAIRGNVRLHTLILNNTAVTDKGLELVKHFSKINQLDLVGMNNITDAGIEAVANQKSLRIVHINNTHITDAGLAKLATIPNLESMGMSYSDVTGKGFVEFLKQQPQLQRVSCGGVGLTDKDIQSMPEMKDLVLLKIQNSSLTDACIPAIVKACPNLVHLDIAGSAVTTSGLAPLAALPKLRQIDCGSCPRVDTQQATTELSALSKRKKILVTRAIE